MLPGDSAMLDKEGRIVKPKLHRSAEHLAWVSGTHRVLGSDFWPIGHIPLISGEDWSNRGCSFSDQAR